MTPKNMQHDDNNGFLFKIEQFADVKILRYRVPEFEKLNLKQKKLIYYLSKAACSGRDIIWSQNNRYNLKIRRTLEAIVKSYNGDRNCSDFKNFMVYVKRIWFSNGIHHHYSTDKFIPGFTEKYFRELLSKSDDKLFPLNKGEFMPDLIEKLIPIIFDVQIYSKRVVLDTEKDLIAASANNYYENVTQKEVEEFYARMDKGDPKRPVSIGLNSKLIKKDGVIKEKTWKLGGMYSEAIEKIIFWLEKALPVTETKKQKKSLSKLIEFYKTGSLKTFDEYSILWVQDLESQVDVISGFIEVYGDSLAIKGSWESLVNFKNIKAAHRTETISANAQWFEDNSPVDRRFKKIKVKGVSAKVVTVAMLGGDCHPAVPIGINLPNAEWIRKEHGSKSVTIDNITYAYNRSSLKEGVAEEFAFSEDEISRLKKYGYLGDSLHTDLHECLGHGSGKLLPDVGVDALKNYHSTLEETRADLFALYYIMDAKLIELGLVPDFEVAKTVYDSYIRGGLVTQLARIEIGKDIEESHMRNRQLIAFWAFQKGAEENVIQKIVKNEKTYFVVRNYQRLRQLFGELLVEVQRIKSEGDFKAGKELVEKYAVKVNREMHSEVKKRFDKLNVAPYAGFINPDYEPVYDGDKIVDVKISYPTDFTRQMLDYSEKYSFLPDYD